MGSQDDVISFRFWPDKGSQTDPEPFEELLRLAGCRHDVLARGFRKWQVWEPTEMSGAGLVGQFPKTWFKLDELGNQLGLGTVG